MDALFHKAINYTYRAGQVLYTTDASGNRRAFNIYSPAGNIIAAKQYENTHQGEYVTYLSDFRNSITSILDDEGNFIQGYRYTDYGITTRIGSGAFNEFAYTQGIWDELTGLYYLNARFYNPVDGRFLTQDPYRGSNDQPDTWHLYGYCIGNPINFIDPTGHRLVIPAAGSRNTMGGLLQQLTRYRVNVDNRTGRVTVDRTARNRRPGRPLPSGNRLIRRIANFGSSAIVEIRRQSHLLSSRYYPRTRIVDVRTSGGPEPVLIACQRTGHGFRRGAARRFVLAHELVHADRHQRGVFLRKDKNWVDNRITVRRNGRGVNLRQRIPREEFFTIGLNKTWAAGTNENTIRHEQNAHRRICWTNPWTD